MMKTRLSADAADAANRNTQAKSTHRDRMPYRSMRGLPSFDKPKTLRMINHGGAAPVSWPKPAFLGHLTPCPSVPHGVRDERFPRHFRHLPRDYELAIRWLRPSFLT